MTALYLTPKQLELLREPREECPPARVWRRDIAAWFVEVGFEPIQVFNYTDVVMVVFQTEHHALMFKMRWL